MKNANNETFSAFKYREASLDDLNKIWEKNIANNAGDHRWVIWKDGAIENNRVGIAKTFVIINGEEPIGEGTLLLSPLCGAIKGRNELSDGVNTTNVNGLRIDKRFEGKSYMSNLVRFMEHYAKDAGYKIITIGVEAKETRNLAIYLHWGYNTFITSEVEDDELVLYYSKVLED